MYRFVQNRFVTCAISADCRGRVAFFVIPNGAQRSEESLFDPGARLGVAIEERFLAALGITDAHFCRNLDCACVARLKRAGGLCRRCPSTGGWRRACISAWWRGIGGREAPEWREDQRHRREDAWRRRDAASAGANPNSC